MQFKPFVFENETIPIPVLIQPMTQRDAEMTNHPPLWQTSWTSDYLSEPRFEKYAAKIGDELIAFAAYEILDHSAAHRQRLCRRHHSGGENDRLGQALRN